MEQATLSRSQTMPKQLWLGAGAGVISSLSFIVVHEWMISNIWFMAVPMLLAGALSGMALVWSFKVIVGEGTLALWLGYNFLFVALLYIMQPISLLIYDPVMTMTEILLSEGGLPDELLFEIIPFVSIFTLIMAYLIVRLYGPKREHFLPAFVTSATLMLLLGLNIAPLGLVELSSGWQRLLLEQFVLIVGLALVFALAYWGLKRLAGKAVK